MDIKIIESALKDYKRKKSIIETTLLRIDTYKKAIEDPDTFYNVFLGSSRELGMPRGTSSNYSSVESAMINKEESIEKNIKREKIRNETVESQMLDSDVGYISIASFDEITADDFKKQLNDLKSKNMKMNLMI